MGKGILESLSTLTSFSFIFCSFILTGCEKEIVKPIPTSNLNYRYEIHLENNKVSSYRMFKNDTLYETETIVFHDSICEIFSKGYYFETLSHEVYYLGTDGLAISSVDSGFFQNDTAIYLYDYTYDNGYLISTKLIYDTTTDVRYDYQYSDGNNTLTTITVNGSWKGSTSFNYNQLINKIDVTHFDNGITGKINQNLVSHEAEGGPCGPSSVPGFSDYKYELNQDGFITKKITYHTPCSSGSYLPREIIITTYEYY